MPLPHELPGLTKAQLDKLLAGDVIEMGQLLPGLTEEPLVWEYHGKEGILYHFTVTYFGARLGSFHLVADGDTVVIKKEVYHAS